MDDVPDAALMLPDPDEAERGVRSLGHGMFAAKFREAAARALLRRRRPGATPVATRKRAADLLAVASRFGSFPIVLEAYRECLRDVFDMPALVETLGAIRSRAIRVGVADTSTPSPFAASLLFGYVANYIYDGDAPLAERRAQALSIDYAQLRSAGDAELLSCSSLPHAEVETLRRLLLRNSRARTVLRRSRSAAAAGRRNPGRDRPRVEGVNVQYARDRELASARRVVTVERRHRSSCGGIFRAIRDARLPLPPGFAMR